MKKIDTTTPSGVKKFFETYWQELDLKKQDDDDNKFLSLDEYDGSGHKIIKIDGKLQVGFNDYGCICSYSESFEDFTGEETLYIGGNKKQIKLTDINWYSHFEIKEND